MIAWCVIVIVVIDSHIVIASKNERGKFHLMLYADMEIVKCLQIILITYYKYTYMQWLSLIGNAAILWDFFLMLKIWNYNHCLITLNYIQIHYLRY